MADEINPANHESNAKQSDPEGAQNRIFESKPGAINQPDPEAKRAGTQNTPKPELHGAPYKPLFAALCPATLHRPHA